MMKRVMSVESFGKHSLVWSLAKSSGDKLDRKLLAEFFWVDPCGEPCTNHERAITVQGVRAD